MKKTIIGIVAKSIDYDDGNFIWYDQTINSNLRYAILHNGAIPIGILPTMKTLNFSTNDCGNDRYKLSNEEKNNLKEQIALCDGIILQGGQFSDSFEEWIANYCFKNNIPTLGICAGYNNMIRGLGGKTKENDKKEVHNRSDLKYSHQILVDKNSNFYKIVGCENFKTNSIHDYVADNLKNLTAVGFSDDGFIEIVENTSKKFYLGVKFHPEFLFLEDKIHNNIFKYFIGKCKTVK